jgi:2-dehydro-3-deoxyphosphooctonate aldolase (KDO 8-P synthase)
MQPILNTNASFIIGLDNSIQIGGDSPIFVICGPCVIESRDHILKHAEAIKKIADNVGIGLIFKSSYDKANRTSVGSFRGIGIDEGLKILQEVRKEFSLPIITDVHTTQEVELAAKYVDILQIPAFLSRQTDLLISAGKTQIPLMIKKGQFLAPEDMYYAVQKVNKAGNERVILCERGTCFGYRDLIVDFRSLDIMAKFGVPVVFDATHSVQVMGGNQGASSGKREYISLLARSAVAAGVNGVFIECHENPKLAPSDSHSMLPINELEALLFDIKRIHELKLLTRKI